MGFSTYTSFSAWQAITVAGSALNLRCCLFAGPWLTNFDLVLENPNRPLQLTDSCLRPKNLRFTILDSPFPAAQNIIVSFIFFS
jgi:hypothetical protein